MDATPTHSTLVLPTNVTTGPADRCTHQVVVLQTPCPGHTLAHPPTHHPTPTAHATPGQQRWLHTHFEPALAGIPRQCCVSTEVRSAPSTPPSPTRYWRNTAAPRKKRLRTPRNTVAHAKSQKHKPLNGVQTTGNGRIYSNTYTTTSYKGTKETASVYR